MTFAEVVGERLSESFGKRNIRNFLYSQSTPDNRYSDGVAIEIACSSLSAGFCDKVAIAHR